MRPAAALELLDEPLTDEEQILDAFVGGMAAGQTTPDMFERLHQAAVRDDRVANLGFAYERLPRDTRVKLLPKQKQVELWLHAATFFSDVFGDEAAAVAHAERAVAIAPESTEAFARLEQLLVATQDGVKLAKACSGAASHQRDPKEKLRLLRRAVELLEAFSGSAQQSIVLLQQILELDPSDKGAREALEQHYLATRRGRDLAKLLEQTLEGNPAASPDEADDIRLRLVGLYRGELRDPQKAAPHVEALLDRDPVSEQAIQAAEALLDHRALIGKLAPKLSNVYERLGRPEDEATTLNLELKTARPPRLTEVHRRLAVLRQEVLQDPAGALELLEPLIAKDPTDDELRRRYLDVSATFHRQVEAARLLTRSISTVKDLSTRARIGLEVARLYVNEGESRRAQSTLEQVLHQAQDDETRLAAARLLIDVQDQVEDMRLLAQALEHVVRLDPELSNRVPAAKRLAEIADKEGGDPGRAILAWRTLIHSPRADEALDRLEALSVEQGDHEGLVEVLEQRAARASSPDEARSLAFRAAETRSDKLPDRQKALAAWRQYLSKYGPSREVYARMIPLLEQTKAYEELAEVLERDVGLAEASERARGLGRLAQVRLSHLGDPKGALDAFKAALSADPHDKQSRRAVERMLGQREHRVAAADVLERVYLAEGNFEGVIKTLVARADAADAPGDQLRYLQQAADHVAQGLKDARRGLDVAGRALRVAVSAAPGEIADWLSRLESFAREAADPALRARLLSEALADHPVDSPMMSALARTAGEALVAAGDAAAAIEVYRRALAFEPSSAELLGRIDELLREQGSPEERLALYRSALEEPAEPARRREVMHAIARIQHKDLGDTAGAVATWRRLIAENPADQTAHAALVEAYGELGDREALVAELKRGLEHIKGPRRVATRLKVAEVLAQDGETARALDEYRNIMEEYELEPEALEAIAELADAEGDAQLVRLAAEKRAQAVTEPDEQVRAQERLGEVLSEYFDDHDGAMKHFLQAARVSRDTATDVERTRRLFERVLALGPDHHESAEALLLLYVEQGAFSEAPAVFSVMLRSEGGFTRAVDLLFDLAPRMRESGAIEPIVAMADEALGQQGADAARRSRELMLLKANVLIDTAESRAEVAGIYRGLVETHGRDEDADAFESFLTSGGAPEDALDEWRWLLGWRAEHSQDPIAALIRWGEFEETMAKDPARAERVYGRVLEADDSQMVALQALCRLRAAQGDDEGVLKALDRLAEIQDGEESIVIDLHRANLLVGSLGDPARALPLLKRILQQDPTNTEAVMITRVALDHPDVRDAAVELLDGVASSVADPMLATNVLDALLRASAGVAPLREARARWYERLVGLREDDPEAALAVAVAGARELPDSEALWDRAERLSRRAKRPEVLAGAYRDALAGALAPDVAESVGRRMVEFHEEWFDDPEAVLAMLERVLALSPRARWALDRVKLALNAEGRWEELFKLYDQAIAESPDPEEREDLLDEAALAAKDLANDPDRAIRYFERLAESRPKDPRIESTLERLYERQGSKKQLIELLERRLPGLEGRERVRLERRLAGLWLDVGAIEPAFALIEKLLESRSDDPQAFELLERILDEAPVELGRSRRRKGKKAAPKTVVDKAYALLEAQYEGTGRIADLVRVMRARMRFIATQKDRVARLGEILSLQTKIEDFQGAFKTVSELVQLEPKQAAHRSTLDELAVRTGHGMEQVELLVSVADSTGDPKTELELVRQAAAVAKDRLAERGLSIELYQRLLKLSGSSPNMALTATRELDELLATAGRSRDRCAVLETMASVERDADRKRAALAEVARIALDQLDEPERAAAAWRARLDDDPMDLDALDGIDPILDRLERYEELAEVLDRRASLTEGDESRRDRVRLARLREERLLDRPGAIEQWRLVRKTFGEDEESFDALTGLLESEARWQELAALVSETASSARGLQQKRELFRMLGDIHRQHTGEPMLAIRAYLSADDWESARAVAGSVADRELARDVVAGLLDLAIRRWQADDSDPDSPPARTAHWTIQSLVKRLLEEGASDRVVQLQLRGAALPFHRAERRQLSRDAAWTACDRLEDTDRAIEILQELFGEDAGDEVAGASVARFARLLEETGRDADLAGLWEQQARARSAAGDRAGAAALWARAADIWERRIGDVDRAIAVHRQGAAIGGEASLEALARLYKTKDDFRAAAMALEWLCAQSSRETLAVRALELADVYVSLGERERARARLEHAAATALDATEVRARLGDLYRQSKSYNALAALLVDEAALAEDASTRLSRLVEAADLHLRKRNDPASAVPLLEQAVELDPEDASLRLVLSQALASDRRYDDAAAILKAQIERYGGRKPKGRAQVHLYLARVCLAAGRRAEALGELDLASKIDPAHPAILYELSKLALQENQLARAEKTFRALLLVLRKPDDSDDDMPGRAEVYLALSEIASRQGEAERAAEFVESAFEAALDSPEEARALERSLEAQGRYDLLARAVESRLAVATEPAVAAKALADLVVLHSERLGASADVAERVGPRADRIYDELAEDDDLDREAWGALSRVYEWLGRPEAEARVLERRVKAILRGTPSEEDAEALYRLAAIRLTEADALDEGVELLTRALEAKPEFERAEDLLVKAVEAVPAHEGLLRLLERVARRSGRELSLVEAIALAAGAPFTPFATIREGVELGLSLKQRAKVVRVLRGALGRKDAFEPPDVVWMHRELARLVLLEGDARAAADSLESGAALAEPDVERTLLLEVAELAVTDLDDLDRAARIYKKLLERHPADREVWEPLLDVYRRQGARSELIELIERTVPLVDSLRDRNRLRLEEATLMLEETGRQAEAEALLRDIITEDPGLHEAAETLTALYEREGKFDELAELVGAQLDVAKTNQDVEAVESMSLKLGALLERQERFEEALDVYRTLLDWSERSVRALRAIVRLSDRGGADEFELADAIEALLAAEQPENVRPLTERLIDLRRRQGDEALLDRALDLGFSAEPGNADLREQVVMRATAAGDHLRAARALRRSLGSSPGTDRPLLVRALAAYRQCRHFDEAIEVVDAAIEARPDAELLFERFRLLSGAERPAEALGALRAAHQESGVYQRELIEALEGAIARRQVEDVPACTIELVDLLEGTGQTSQARHHLSQLLKEHPKHRDALRRLAWLASSEGRWEEASAAYRRLIPLEQGDDLVSAAMNLADACERGDRLADARGGLERALAVAVDNADLKQRLRELYEATGAHRELAHLLLEDAAKETKVSAKADQLIRAAELLLEKNRAADEAIKVLEEVQGLMPESIQAAVLLGRAHVQTGHNDRAMAALTGVVTAHRGRRIRELSQVYQEMANIHLEDGDLSAALETLSKAFDMDMRNGELAMQLGYLALDLDDQDIAQRAFRAVTMMRVRSDAGSEGVTPEGKAVAYYHLSRIAHAQGDVRKARLMASKAVSENPNHEDAQSLLEELRAS